MTTVEQEKAKYEQVWKSEDYRKFSPGLRAIKDFNLLDIIKKDRIRSVLDVGCGSGKAMQYLLTQMPELRVHGFDIASNCLDDFFKGSDCLTTGCLWSDPLPEGYDTIICTDVMEHIDPEHVEASLKNIYDSCKVSAFFCIALFPDKFGALLLGEPLHLSLFSADEWVTRILESGFSAMNYRVVESTDKKPMWLYAYCEKWDD